MENEMYIAKVSTTINAPITKVWDALTNPEIIRQFMFGTEVVSEWSKGSPIVWKGTWEGKPYEDKGVILAIEAKIRSSTRTSARFPVPPTFRRITIT